MEARVLLSVYSAVGQESLINVPGTGTQVETAGKSVKVAADNSYAVVWASKPGDGSASDVYARRYAADGKPLTDPIQVNTTTTGDQDHPAVAVAQNGQFTVAWESHFPDGSGTSIVVRQFAADGTPLTTELRANTTISGNHEFPDVAYLTNGAFNVVWSGNGVGDDSGVFVRLFDSKGVPLFREVRINATTAGVQEKPAIVADDAGGFAVVWDGNGFGDSNGVFFRHFSPKSILFPEFRVNQTTIGVQSAASIDVRFDGGFVVAWQGEGNGDSSGVFARILNKVGAPVSNEILVNQKTTGIQELPSVSASGKMFTVAWDGNGIGDSAGVFLRTFDRNGDPLENEVLVNTTVSGVQENATVAAMAGGLVVTWDGNGSAVGTGHSADPAGVFAQRFTRYNFVVNSLLDTVDANPGDGIAADVNGLTTLRAAIMEANALQKKLPAPITMLITLGPGTYNLMIPGRGEDAAAQGDLDILGSIEITGTGALATFVNAQQLDRVFHVLPGASLSLRGLTVEEGNATDPLFGGGGIAVDHGSLFLADDGIVENKATTLPGITGGGGIAAQDGYVSIYNTFVDGNSASEYGGGLFANRTTTIIAGSSVIALNSAAEGGGGLANLGGGTMNVSDSEVNFNRMTQSGGGILNDFSTLNLSNVKVLGNGTLGDGGGLLNIGGIVGITNSHFSANTAGGLGGGVENNGGKFTPAKGVMNISGSYFTYNRAANGGGLDNKRDSQMTIADSFVNSNTATGYGGGIENAESETFGPGQLMIRNTNVSLNTAGAYGGGIFAYQSDTDVLALSQIDGNKAAAGGGLANLGGRTMTVKDSEVNFNNMTQSGGGIQNELSILNLNNATVKGNSTSGDGGGLFNFAGIVGITNCNFSLNTAGGLGGGVENTGNSSRFNAPIGTMTITGSTFTDNQAANGGGLDNKRDSQMRISDSFVENNTVTGYGGGIENAETETFGPGYLRVQNTQVTGNKAAAYGGGIFAYQSNTDVLASPKDVLFSSKIDGNQAAAGGGLANLGGGTMNVSNSEVSFNIMTQSGGGIQNELSPLNLTNDSIKRNSTSGDGGGLFNFAGIVGITNCNFSLNTAGGLGGGVENTGNSSRFNAPIGTMTITGSTFTDNQAADGGGLDNKRDSQMAIADSFVFNNTVTGYGGGIENAETETFGPGHLTIWNTQVTLNTAGAYGGGIFAYQSDTDVLASSKIDNNQAAAGGGLANLGGRTMTVTDSEVNFNKMTQSGGGIQNELSTLILTNTTIAGNSTSGDGGGVYVVSGIVTLTNDSVNSNIAGFQTNNGYGGGIFIVSGATVYVDSFTVANTNGNTDSNGQNSFTANIDGTYILLP
jgi:hypothetical protein